MPPAERVTKIDRRLILFGWSPTPSTDWPYRCQSVPGTIPKSSVAERPDPTAPTAVAGDAIADAVPAIPTIDLRVAQSKAEAALFGASEAVRIGRYRILERVGAGGMGVVWSAWDPELGRAVALKLASSGDAATRALARDEARALARLSHPNVVPIYDVLDHDDRVLLVMELIKGESLRAACKTRSTAQIIRDYRQAGEGLAAAHAAGLIHRDFKPDNALLGADGRVRVLDFGLAHDAGGGEGFVAGTPGYMAPEQERGEKLTPAVDQFALCVALRESLGAHGGVPRWLVPVLARGTAADAADRYPSMTDLLAALALDPATRWRRRALTGGGALALAGAAGAFLLGRAQQAPVEEPCSGGPGLLAPSWGPNRRAAIAQALRSLPEQYAKDSVPALLATVDRYAASWVTLHRESCRAHQRRELSTELYDRRIACLNRPRAALATIADLAEHATAPELPGLVQALVSLPDVAACSDDAALVAGVPAPAASVAAEVSAIDAGLARVDVERDAGRVEQAARDVEPLLARADATDYAPVQARAHLARGRVAMTGERGDWGQADFAAALRTALAAGDDVLAVEAWARRAWGVAMLTEDGIGDALDGRALVLPLADRTRERGDVARVLLHNNLGSIALADGDRAVALAEFSSVRDAAEHLSGPGAAELTAVLENLLLLTHAPDDRASLGRSLVAKRRSLLGEHHPLTLQAEAMAAAASDDLASAQAGMAAAVLALARFHPSLGHTIADLAREPLWLATLADDRSTVEQLADAVTAARDHGAEPAHQAFARACRAVVAGTPAAATLEVNAQLAQLGDPSRLTWWQRRGALDLHMVAALAALRAGDLDRARIEVDLASTVLTAIADALPVGSANRRRAALAQLAAQLR